MGWAGNMIIPPSPVSADRFWNARWVLRADCGCGNKVFCGDDLSRRQIRIYDDERLIACIAFPSRAVAESIIGLRETNPE